MAITLRTVTGSALSHTQLDTNFSSYFYSASISASVVNLHYTGSSAIGLLPRSASIILPSASKWTDIAGGGITRNSQVQITGSTNISGSTGIVGNFTQGFSGLLATNFSHAEGYLTIASGAFSHAEGYLTTTTGSYSHTEGQNTRTVGVGSHAEGNGTQAIGDHSHAEGYQTEARGIRSHAEGARTVAIGESSHTEGQGTVASGSYQHVQGEFNIPSLVQGAFIIGNGVDESTRSNLVVTSGSTFQVTGSLNVTGSFGLRNGAQGAGYILTSDANGAATWSPSFAIESIVTTTNITTETTGSAGLSQRGRCVIIDNGGNNINLTVNGSAGFTATYIKHGSGSVAFVQGSGRTLIPVDGTLNLNGTSGSTATVISYSTSDYLRVNNA